MAYKHLFFDLDHTLWDFERNASETLAELHATFGLSSQGIGSVGVFQETFSAVNAHLWHLYDTQQINQSELRHRRFREVFDRLGVPDSECCDALGEEFLRICPRKGHLVAQARETLDYLAPRYDLHVITNGFDEIQALKMAYSGLTPYFRHVNTAQNAGARKPDPRIFAQALRLANCVPAEGLMIGDNAETDIAGGQAAGLDTVFYNPERLDSLKQATFTIDQLGQLTDFL